MPVQGCGLVPCGGMRSLCHRRLTLRLASEAGAGGTRVGWKAGSTASTTDLRRWVGTSRCSWIKYTGAGLTVRQPCQHSKWLLSETQLLPLQSGSCNRTSQGAFTCRALCTEALRARGWAPGQLPVFCSTGTARPSPRNAPTGTARPSPRNAPTGTARPSTQNTPTDTAQTVPLDLRFSDNSHHVYLFPLV